MSTKPAHRKHDQSPPEDLPEPDGRQEIASEVETTDCIAARWARKPRVRRTRAVMTAYAQLVGSGLSHVRASALLQVSRETVWRWRSDHAEFQAEIERETAKAVHARLRVVNLAISAGDVAAARWWLERTHGGEYASKAIGLQVNVGAEGASAAAVIFLPQKDGAFAGAIKEVGNGNE